ncbi:hypothetical protein SPRG_17475, partial [Saprolegnia parasitica CBS 223.65]
MGLPPHIENADDILLGLPSLGRLLVTDDDASTETRQNRYRKRQKDERDYLREQVETLTSQLNVLRQVKSVELATSSTWKKAAQNQRAYACEAAMENKRLKRALEDQLKLATALDQLLVKRPRLL